MTESFPSNSYLSTRSVKGKNVNHSVKGKAVILNYHYFQTHNYHRQAFCFAHAETVFSGKRGTNDSEGGCEQNG